MCRRETPIRSQSGASSGQSPQRSLPDSSHVYLLGLDQVDDTVIREYAQQNDFLIVTKDADFSDMCLLLGFPPKVIWIRRGNCKTSDIETILRNHYDEIEALSTDHIVGVLALF